MSDISSYSMDHEKVPVLVYIKVGIYSCNRNGMFGTRHGLFNSELNGPFNGKLNGLFNTSFQCFQLSE